MTCGLGPPNRPHPITRLDEDRRRAVQIVSRKAPGAFGIRIEAARRPTGAGENHGVRSVRRRGGHSDQGSHGVRGPFWSRWGPRPWPKRLRQAIWSRGRPCWCSWLIRLPSAGHGCDPSKVLAKPWNAEEADLILFVSTDERRWRGLLWAAVAEWLRLPAISPDHPKLRLQDHTGWRAIRADRAPADDIIEAHCPPSWQ